MAPRKLTIAWLLIVALLAQPVGLWAATDCGCSVAGGNCAQSTTEMSCCCGEPSANGGSGGCLHCQTPGQNEGTSQATGSACNCGDQPVVPIAPPTGDSVTQSQLMAMVSETADGFAGVLPQINAATRPPVGETGCSPLHFKQVVLCVWLT